MIHRFSESLAKSHDAEDWPVWEEIYRTAFPQFLCMVNHRQDGEHQRAGIDRSIILKNSKQILIDEKVRYKDYGLNDIAIEYLSSEEYGTPGWAVKQIRADYIAYAILPSGICHMLPVIQLQSAWHKYGECWKSKYFIAKARNTTWTTASCCVPVDVLYSKIGACLRVNFNAQNNAPTWRANQ